MRKKRKSKHKELLDSVRIFYDRMLDAQQGVCGICARMPSDKRKLDIDHDHISMTIRGLLCARCNRAIPSWMDSRWCREAANYLDQPEVPIEKWR